MLAGHFKAGSHREYSGGEGTGLLSDTSEGNGGTFVRDDVINFTGMIGGITLKNFSSIGNGGSSIVVRERVDSLMFCSSGGDYDFARHRRIVDGDLTSNYPANEQCTAFVTLNSDALRSALEQATNELFQRETHWIFRPVVYTSRNREIASRDFRGVSQLEIMQRTFQQAFTKPVHFRAEEEYRFLLVPQRGLSMPINFFTSQLSGKVQQAFQAAIVDTGDSHPRS